jgi:hypothetical protein
MMRPRIQFTDWEIDQLVNITGLSKLEIVGVIAAMNRFTQSDEAIARWEHDEAMGRHI